MIMGNADKSNMKQVLIDYPKQFRKGLEISKGVKLEGNFNRVIMNGMGGSALPADLAALYLGRDFPVIVNRDYTLPRLLGDDLVFIISYSGNTEEALAAYGEARIEGANIVGFSAGGILEEWCKRDGVPHVKFPKEGPNFQPRCATGYMFSAMLNVLSNCGAIKSREAEITAIGEHLNGLGESETGGYPNEIAHYIGKRMPVIYSSDRMSIIARMWKIKFNENSKIMAFWNVFPELNHNEMAGYTEKPDKYFFIIIRDPDDHERVRKRMGLTGKLIEERGGKPLMVEMKGPTPITRAFSAVWLGDWVSYYLAMENKTDPTPVDIIEEFKKRLLE